MFFFSKNYSLAELTYLQIRLNKTKFFLRYTNKTDRNCVNQHKTHRKITLDENK